MARRRNSFWKEAPEVRVVDPSFVYHHPPKPPEKGLVWDFRDQAPMGLAKEFAKRLSPIAQDMFRGRSWRTVACYQGAYRSLGKLLLQQGREIRTLRDLRPEDLNALDLPSMKSKFRCLPRMFRWFKADDPDCFSEAFVRRFQKGSNGSVAKPREPVPDDVHRALQIGADAQLAMARDRISAGRAFFVNLHENVEKTRLEKIAYRFIDGETISLTDKDYYQRGDFGKSIPELRCMLHLSASDAAAIVISLATRVKIPLESIKRLKRDCLIRAAGGTVHVRYEKTRAGKILSEKCRDGGINTPGGIIRLALDLSEHAAARLRADGSIEGDYLLAGFSQTSHPQIKLLPMSTQMLNKSVENWSITDSHGGAITKAHAVRLRKNAKATEYREVRGHIRKFASDNSVKVAGFHYARLEVFGEEHARAIEAAQNDLLRSAQGPRVLSGDNEAAVRKGNIANASVRLSDIDGSKLDGDFDTFLGVCLDFWNSPIDQESDGSCGSGFTVCLHCRNAVFHRRKLPALIAYNDYMLSKRSIMSVTSWRDTFGLDWARINLQIFPEFNSDELDEAAAIAATGAPPLPLPPHNRAA